MCAQDLIKTTALLFALLLPPRVATADEPIWREPFAAPAIDLVEAVDVLDTPGEASIQFIRYGEVFEFSADGRRVYRDHRIYRLLDHSAIDGAGTVAANWNPSYQDRPEIRARVIGADGTEHVLDSGTLVEQPMQSDLSDVFSDSKCLVAPLPLLRIGSIVEVETVVRDREPYFAGGIACRRLVPIGLSVEDRELSFRVHRSVPFRWKFLRGNGTDPLESKDGAWVQYDFQFGRREAADFEDLISQDEYTGALMLAFSTGESWAEVVRLYSEIVASTLEGHSPTEEVEDLIDEGGTRLETIQRLARHVRSTLRYTGLELNSSGIVARRPSEVDERGYGDCKDQATYLVACLRAAGIDAHLALVLTGPDVPVTHELPGLGIFDHAIVYVPGDPDRWIDPTDEVNPLFELSTNLRHRRALIVDEATTHLAEIPGSSVEQNVHHEIRIIRIVQHGPGSVTEITRPRGSSAAAYRQAFRFLGAVGYEASLKSYAETLYSSSRTEEVVLSGFEDPDAPLEIRIEIAESPLVYTAESDAVVWLPTQTLFDELGWLELNEGGSLKLDAPFASVLEYRIECPPTLSVIDVPSTFMRAFGCFSIRMEFEELDATTLAARFEFRAPTTILEPMAAENLISWLQTEEMATGIPISFEHRGESYLVAGLFQEALDEFRAEEMRFPDSAIPLTRLSRLYLALGLGQAAQELAAVAVEREPDSSVANRALSIALMHDSLGRLLTGKVDRERALHHLVRALDLNPEDEIGRVYYASLLAVGDDGANGSSGSDVEEAYSQLLTLREQYANAEYDAMALLKLMELRRFETLGAFSRLSGLDPMVKGTTDLLDAQLNRDGRGLVRTSTRIRPDEVAIGALFAAAFHMMRVQEYSGAAELLELVSKRDLPPEVRQKIGTLIEPLKDGKTMDSLLEGEERPETPVLRLFQLASSSEPEYEDLGEIFVGPMADNQQGVDTVRGAEMILQSFNEVTLGLFPAGAQLDALAMTLEWKVSDDESAVRTVSIGAGGTWWGVTFEVASTSKGYRIVDVGSQFGKGWYALERLSSGDEEVAERILEDAYEAISSSQEETLYDGATFVHLWDMRKGDDGPSLEDCAQALALSGGSKDARRHLEKFIEHDDYEHFDQMRWSASYELVLNAYARRDERAVDSALDSILALPERSEELDEFAVLFLTQRDRLDKAESVILSHQVGRPDSGWPRTALAQLRARQGRFEESVELYEAVVEDDIATVHELNNLAWYAICADAPSPRHVRLLHSAKAQDPSALHTMAVLHACLGDLSEARSLAVLAMERKNLGEPNTDYTLISAKIAEQLGEWRIAEQLYEQILDMDEEHPGPSSSQRLAERWLAQMRMVEGEMSLATADANGGP